MSNSDKAPQDAASEAADALMAAQQAVSSINAQTQSAPVAGSDEDAAVAALMAAQQAINAAKSVNPPLNMPSLNMPSPAPTSAPAPATGHMIGSGASPQPVNLPSFSAAPTPHRPEGIDLLSDVNLNVKIELGRTRMLVEDVLRLGEGSVVELDKLAGDPVDVYVNDRHVARGEVLVLNENFCVRINEIVASIDQSPGGRGKR